MKMNERGSVEAFRKRGSCPTIAAPTPHSTEAPRGRPWRKPRRPSCYPACRIWNFPPLSWCPKTNKTSRPNGILLETLAQVPWQTNPLGRNPCIGFAFDVWYGPNGWIQQASFPINAIQYKTLYPSVNTRIPKPWNNSSRPSSKSWPI